MGLLSKFFNNARKPAGFLGKMMVNAQAIRESRCKVVEGAVAELPFGKDTFDMVTAFETIYFWPDIEHCFNEVKRVLKDGGVFAIVNEDDGLSSTSASSAAAPSVHEQGCFLSKFTRDNLKQSQIINPSTRISRKTQK